MLEILELEGSNNIKKNKDLATQVANLDPLNLNKILEGITNAWS